MTRLLVQSLSMMTILSFVLISGCKIPPDSSDATSSDGTIRASDLDILNTIEKRFRFLPNNSVSLLKSMGPNGSYRYNRKCDGVKSSDAASCPYYIEEQRKAFIILFAGVYHKNQALIDGGLKILKWGFSRQDSNGGFSASMDGFHSTSFFLDAAAHSLLILKESNPNRASQSDVISMVKAMVPALEWFISEPLWTKGTGGNSKLNHRHFVVASAIGLTLKALNAYGITPSADLAKRALEKMNSELSIGISSITAEGIMPELGGHDSSYQMAGVMWGSYWLAYHPNNSLSQKLKATLKKMSDWELTRINTAGEITTKGNRRTGISEVGRTGVRKKVDYKMVIKGLYYISELTNDPKYIQMADKVAKRYYKK